MGKAEAKADAKPKAEAKAKASSNSKEDHKHKAKHHHKHKHASEAVPRGYFGQPRLLFPFCLFLLFCIGLVLLHDPCDVKEKKRQDCGYHGMGKGYCTSFACFTKGGKAATGKLTVKVTRSEGTALGIEVTPDKVDGLVRITSIGEGAVQEHNKALGADAKENIRVGDIIEKVDGTTGKDKKKPQAGIERMVKALSGTKAGTVALEIHRPRLYPWLMWIRSTSGKPGNLEKVLTAPGSKRFAKTFSYLGGAGLTCWLISGYGFASLPLYYGGLSAGVAFYTHRCCHNDKVSGGTPHCYKSGTESIDQALLKAKETGQALFSKFMQDPMQYFRGVLKS